MDLGAAFLTYTCHMGMEVDCVLIGHFPAVGDSLGWPSYNKEPKVVLLDMT